MEWPTFSIWGPLNPFDQFHRYFPAISSLTCSSLKPSKLWQLRWPKHPISHYKIPISTCIKAFMILMKTISLSPNWLNLKPLSLPLRLLPPQLLYWSLSFLFPYPYLQLYVCHFQCICGNIGWLMLDLVVVLLGQAKKV